MDDIFLVHGLQAFRYSPDAVPDKVFTILVLSVMIVNETMQSTSFHVFHENVIVAIRLVDFFQSHDIVALNNIVQVALLLIDRFLFFLIHLDNQLSITAAVPICFKYACDSIVCLGVNLTPKLVMVARVFVLNLYLFQGLDRLVVLLETKKDLWLLEHSKPQGLSKKPLLLPINQVLVLHLIQIGLGSCFPEIIQPKPADRFVFVRHYGFDHFIIFLISLQFEYMLCAVFVSIIINDDILDFERKYILVASVYLQ